MPADGEGALKPGMRAAAYVVWRRVTDRRSPGGTAQSSSIRWGISGSSAGGIG